MKVGFFHGLESAPRSEKNVILESIYGKENVYAPPMNYRNPDLYTEILNHLRENPVDLLIGSSMGGYFAHALSSHINKPALLFNPALHGRPYNPENVTYGEYKPIHLFILGRQDTVVNPLETLKIISNADYTGPVTIGMENIGHRIPAAVFEKRLNEFILV